MSLSELFSLRETIESRVNQYWTFWSVSIFAVCGWLFTDSASYLDKTNSTLVVIGLIVFFIANLSVLINATRLSILIHNEIIEKAKKSVVSISFRDGLKKGCTKYRLELTWITHIMIDILLSLVVLAKGWYWWC